MLVLSVACDGGRVEPLTRAPVASPSSTKTRIIGLVGTMSGPEMWRGNDAFEGADLAIQELNRTRASKAPMYELVTLDDGGNPAEATRLVQQLAGSTRTVGVVYAGAPEGLPPAEEALAAARIPAILCYGDLYAARLLSPHVFQASPSYLWQARRLGGYLVGDRGYSKIGLISSGDLSGQTARRSLTLALQEAGSSLSASATYDPDASEFGSAIDVMRRKRVQSVVVQASPTQTATILDELSAAGSRYRSTAAAAASLRRGRRWAPHVAGFDTAISPAVADARPPAGTIAADSYDRGAHYLPIPELESFRRAFEDWWDEPPLGWERRAYDATRIIGWAVKRGGTGRVDLAAELETMRNVRFAGLDITLGPDDHTTVGQTTVGLWTIPRAGISVAERSRLPDVLPWVPLARGFSIDGERTDVSSEDWRYLFRNAPPPKAPAPKFGRSRFGVTTSASDPIH